MKKCNIVLVKVDSDSEINWDEDEDLGDTDIPGVISAFDPVNLFSPKISYFVNNNKKSRAYHHFSSDSFARKGR